MHFVDRRKIRDGKAVRVYCDDENRVENKRRAGWFLGRWVDDLHSLFPVVRIVIQN